MSARQLQSAVDAMFDAAEQAGLKVAIKGRIAAVALIGLLMATTRGPDRAPEFILGALVFAGLGLIHYAIVGSSVDRKWTKYAFLTVDIALLSTAVAILPPTTEVPLPQVMIFRFDIFPFYFIILGISAFSLSPWLVLWAGVAGGVSWAGAFAFVRSQMAQPLNWADIPDNPTTQQFLDIFLNVNFASQYSRLQEAAIYIIVAVLIAVVVWRARQVVRRQFEAERDMTAISQIFGRFVPKAIAESMIANEGTLDPTERQATVLFCDLAGFTKMTEAKGPRAVIDTLNAFFDDAAEIIGKHDGVVTQFQGDGILATFNVPLEDRDHARSAIDAAADLVDLVRSRTFGGERLEIRIGLSTGPLIAGSVGGGGRQSYTVYGEPVNLAARLENLNKTHGTSILLSQSTADLLEGIDLRQIGELEIRGLSEPVGVYSLDRKTEDRPIAAHTPAN